jgi:small GTP-binding protein
MRQIVPVHKKFTRLAMSRPSGASREQNPEFIVKIVLAGESGVGKTNLILRFARGEFDPESKSTIGVEFATKAVTINDRLVTANIWDTAGQEAFRAVTSTYYRGAHGAMLVYDITSDRTFQNAERWLSELRSQADEGIPIILIGNKSDMADDRAVSVAEAQNWAERRTLLFLETSAKTAHNADQAFEQLLAAIVKKLGKSGLGTSEIEVERLDPGLSLNQEERGGCC